MLTYNYNKFPNRDWLCNVINTIAPQKFNEYVTTAMNQWEREMLLNRGLQVDAIPKIVSIFSRSINVSVMKERTHFLLRKQQNSKKRTLMVERWKTQRKQKRERNSSLIKSKNLEKQIETHQKKRRIVFTRQRKTGRIISIRSNWLDGELKEDEDD